MRTTIRLDKVYRETVPVTLLLDERQPFSLDSVPSLAKKISAKNGSTVSKETGKRQQQKQEQNEQEEEEEHVEIDNESLLVLRELECLVTQTEQRIADMGPERDILSSNLLLGRNKRLREYAISYVHLDRDGGEEGRRDRERRGEGGTREKKRIEKGKNGERSKRARG